MEDEKCCAVRDSVLDLVEMSKELMTITERWHRVAVVGLEGSGCYAGGFRDDREEKMKERWRDEKRV